MIGERIDAAWIGNDSANSTKTTALVVFGKQSLRLSSSFANHTNPFLHYLFPRDFLKMQLMYFLP